MKTIKLILTILLLVSISFSQINRGVSVKVKDRNDEAREIKLYDASYALVIGNGNYKYWDSLNGVKSDVSAVEKALKDNGFTVETAMDLDSRSLSQRIGQFVNDYGYEKNNRLLIYYAGHGYTQNSIGDDRELGYIVPVDSPLPSKDRLNFSRTAVDLEEIRTFAKKIQSKHALFLFDSCFSGKLVSRGEVIVPSIIEESIAYPVRQFITAGSANQTVPDESIFRRAFIRGLDGEADLNKDGFILGSELASFLRDKVTNLSGRQQTPLYAKIDDVNLERGDFVFVVPGVATTPAPTTSIQTQPTPKPTPLPTPTPIGISQNFDAEEIFWREISKRDNKSGYENYLAEYQTGKYATQAKNKIKQFNQDELQKKKDIETSKWREAQNQNTRESYNLYLTLYPNGEFAKDARAGIKLLDRKDEQNKWLLSKSANTKEGYNSYLEQYPNGEFASNAKSAIREIEEAEEQTKWDEVQFLNRKSAYQTYLTNYPNGKNASSARQKIKEFDDEEARKLKEQEKAKEKAKWEEAERLKTIKSYKDYLKDYPKGDFASLARLGLRDLGVTTDSPVTRPKMPPVSKVEIERLTRVAENLFMDDNFNLFVESGLEAINAGGSLKIPLGHYHGYSTNTGWTKTLVHPASLILTASTLSFDPQQELSCSYNFFTTNLTGFNSAEVTGNRKNEIYLKLIFLDPNNPKKKINIHLIDRESYMVKGQKSAVGGFINYFGDTMVSKQRAHEAMKAIAALLNRTKTAIYPEKIQFSDPNNASLKTEPSTNEITNSMGIKFIKIPERSFYMGIYEVTQDEYESVMGVNPSKNQNCSQCPVEQVSWDDAQKFIKKLNLKGDGKYRLPTEAEFEYALRAGTTSVFFWGDDESVAENYAWFQKNSGSKTQEVGLMRPNNYGLYDMAGNVWEWCEDKLDSTSSYRIYRGGGMYDSSWYLRSDFRYYNLPSYSNHGIGFRLVREN